jgi:hypothetical protein
MTVMLGWLRSQRAGIAVDEARESVAVYPVAVHQVG